MAEKRIIFLEDNSSLAEFYAKKLSETGYRVKWCMSASEFLNVIDDFVPDLAFLDHALHGDEKSGLEMIPPLKKCNPEIKIVILSNYSEFQMREITKQAGALDYLLKLDTSPADLVHYVNKLFR